MNPSDHRGIGTAGSFGYVLRAAIHALVPGVPEFHIGVPIGSVRTRGFGIPFDIAELPAAQTNLSTPGFTD
jgi:hypothetical protein